MIWRPWCLRILFQPCFIFAGRQAAFRLNSCKYSSRTHMKRQGLLDMDELRHIKRKKQMQERESLISDLPANVYLQVIENGACGFGKSLYLFTSNTCYFFNCPEGMQRLCMEYGVKLARLEHVFVTHNSWANTGGFPGMALTLSDVGVPELTLHGSEGISNIFEATKLYNEIHLKLQVHEHSVKQGPFSDQAIVVESVPIEGGLRPSYEIDSGDSGSETSSQAVAKKKEEKFVPSQREVAVAYICTPKPRPGKIIVKRCLELGVPIGPLLGQLQRGEKIVLENGKEVVPEDVMGPPETPPSFAVVEVPSMDFLESLDESDQFRRFKYKESELNLLVHLSSPEVLSSDGYQRWAESVSHPDTKHLVLNELCHSVPHSSGVFRNQLCLNMVHDRIFPLLPVFDLAQQAPLVQAKLVFPFASEENVILTRPLSKYDLRPLTGFSSEFEVNFKSERETTIEEVLKAPAYAREREDLTSLLVSKSAELVENGTTGPELDPEILFLGTGSAIPVKTRNVSGILLNLSDNLSMLLDCGEGTYAQLFQFYGPEQIEELLMKIQVIFISHLHADHQFGLFSVLLKRKKAFEIKGEPYRPVFLLAPSPIFRMHNTFSRLVEDLHGLCFRIASRDPNDRLKSLYASLGVFQRLQIVKVDHPMQAYGIVIELKNGRKLVYSGDTRPCPALIEAGKDCDVLIHESTMEDELWQDAIAKQDTLLDRTLFKKHSTMAEAIDVSQRMNAAFTILTHFSARYSKIPLISPQAHSDRLGLAFDFMRVRLSELGVLPKLLPLLKAVYWATLEELQQKSELRTFRNEREKEERSASNSPAPAAVVVRKDDVEALFSSAVG